MSKKITVKLFWVVLLSIAFAYIESSVVVYLRAIFYPEGFTFPIADFSQMPDALRFFLTEVGREAATLVLILSAAMLVGKTLRQRLAWFMLIFAVWDIFYYVWLKVLLNWPASLLDWDILFLMPVVWASSVLAPLITSVLMLLVSYFLLSDKPVSFRKTDLLILPGLVMGIIVCFCVGGLNITAPEYAQYFSWPIFITLHIAAFILVLRVFGFKI